MEKEIVKPYMSETGDLTTTNIEKAEINNFLPYVLLKIVLTYLQATES